MIEIPGLLMGAIGMSPSNDESSLVVKNLEMKN